MGVKVLGLGGTMIVLIVRPASQNVPALPSILPATRSIIGTEPSFMLGMLISEIAPRADYIIRRDGCIATVAPIALPASLQALDFRIQSST
jgi:hypothetical protein